MADKIRIQIYEVQEPAEAEILIELGIDHIGSVLLEADQWKQPVLADTLQVVAASSARSSLLPLFSSADMISRALDFYRPDMVHFCESIAMTSAGRRHFDAVVAVQEKVSQRFPEIEMMRSLPIGPPGVEAEDHLFEMLGILEPISHWFLTDTRLPVEKEKKAVEPVAGFIGITGAVCAWDRVAQLVNAAQIPVILAGGLSPDNVYDGIMQVRPAGVDSCTRTNREDGHGGYVRFQKDINKVKNFVAEARRAEADMGEK